MIIEHTVKFGDMYEISSRNGLNRPSAVRGKGFKMVNMGELFANDRIYDIEMERVLLNEKEKVNYKLEKNDLLFARQSIVAEGAGKCSIVLKTSELTCFESHIIRVRLKEDTVPLFYYYLFQSYVGKAALFSIRQQGVQAGIRGSDLEKLKLPSPKQLVKEKIAKILFNYDDLIENNLKRIKLIEESARLTYEEWFLRFKIDGERLEINSKTGLPFGWKKRKLDDICDVTSSKRIFLSDYVDEGVAFYRGKEITIKSQNKSISNEYFISKERFEEIEKRFGSPKKDDILVSAVGTLGSIYLVKESDGKFYFKDGNLIWLKEFTKEDNLYIYYSLKGERLQANISGVAIGSSQKALTIQALKSVEVPYPNNNVIDDFNNKIRPIVNEIENLINQNQLLKEARDILLPRLMTGIIDVADMEMTV